MKIVILSDAFAPYHSDAAPHREATAVRTHALAKSLAGLEHRVLVVSPLYRGIDPQQHALARRLSTLEVSVEGTAHKVWMFEGQTSAGVRTLFLANDLCFGAVDALATDDEHMGHAARSAAFAMAAAKLLCLPGYRGDLVHAMGYRVASAFWMLDDAEGTLPPITRVLSIDESDAAHEPPKSGARRSKKAVSSLMDADAPMLGADLAAFSPWDTRWQVTAQTFAGAEDGAESEGAPKSPAKRSAKGKEKEEATVTPAEAGMPGAGPRLLGLFEAPAKPRARKKTELIPWPLMILPHVDHVVFPSSQALRQVIETCEAAAKAEKRNVHVPLLEAQADVVRDGVDDSVWNPTTDALLASRFDPFQLEGRLACKHAVREALGLATETRMPLVGFLECASDLHHGVHSRDLEATLDGLEVCLEGDAQVVLLMWESSMQACSKRLQAWEARWPEQMRVVILDASASDGGGARGAEKKSMSLQMPARGDHAEAHPWLSQPDRLVHNLLAGADFWWIAGEPSWARGQVGRAQRYGAVPIVLADADCEDIAVMLAADGETGDALVPARFDGDDARASAQRAMSMVTAKHQLSTLRQTLMKRDVGWERYGRFHDIVYQSLVRPENADSATA